MKLRVKKLHENKVLRFEAGGEVKEILINEDLLHPDKESVSLCFKSHNSSGIIDLTPREVDRLYNSIKNKKQLIKDIKIMQFEK
ncbi:hypothetical protein J4466_04390 [Candidatus Pacearchaeota archaeon]|nr:hypothetical protein [Candidatus Pacearchaeota archaeon]